MAEMTANLQPIVVSIRTEAVPNEVSSSISMYKKQIQLNRTNSYRKWNNYGQHKASITEKIIDFSSLRNASVKSRFALFFSYNITDWKLTDNKRKTLLKQCQKRCVGPMNHFLETTRAPNIIFFVLFLLLSDSKIYNFVIIYLEVDQPGRKMHISTFIYTKRRIFFYLVPNIRSLPFHYGPILKFLEIKYRRESFFTFCCSYACCG